MRYTSRTHHVVCMVRRLNDTTTGGLFPTMSINTTHPRDRNAVRIKIEPTLWKRVRMRALLESMTVQDYVALVLATTLEGSDQDVARLRSPSLIPGGVVK